MRSVEKGEKCNSTTAEGGCGGEKGDILCVRAPEPCSALLSLLMPRKAAGKS